MTYRTYTRSIQPTLSRTLHRLLRSPRMGDPSSSHEAVNVDGQRTSVTPKPAYEFGVEPIPAASSRGPMHGFAWLLTLAI